MSITLNNGGFSTVTGDSRYLKLDQTAPQTTIGTFTFPTVNFGSTTGVSTTALNGILTLQGLKTAGFNEDMTIDFETGSNQIRFSSNTGAQFLFLKDLFIADNIQFAFGGGLDAMLRFTTTGNDNIQFGMVCGAVDDSGYLCIVEKADLGVANRSPLATSVNPVLRIYSSDSAEALDYLEFSHNQTNPRVDWGNGDLQLGVGSTTGNIALKNGANLYPSADSTTALGISSFAASTTKWVTFDTTNKRVGINCTPGYDLEIAHAATFATQALSCYSATVTTNPYFTFIKSHNDTLGTLTETIDTDVIGSLLATGINSSSTVATGAGIKFIQNGAAGATYIPIDIIFQTGTEAAARAERMKIDHDGNVTVGSASTNTMTMTARFIPRTTASDPQHITAGSRPAGTVGEIAYYSGKWYGCTNAATPLWEKFTSL